MEVTLNKFDKPLFVEELTFWVRPELLEKYIEIDAELWVPALCTRKGYLGGEVWVGEEGTGEVLMLCFWEDYEDFATLDKAWESDMKTKTEAAIGEGNMRFIGQMQQSKRRWKVREYRPAGA